MNLEDNWFNRKIRWKISRGNVGKFWEDAWLIEVPLKNRFP